MTSAGQKGRQPGLTFKFDKCLKGRVSQENTLIKGRVSQEKLGFVKSTYSSAL